MDIITTQWGQKDLIWKAAKEYLKKEDYVFEEGYSLQGTKRSPNDMEWAILIHFMIAETDEKVCQVRIANLDTLAASFIVMKGPVWDISFLIRNAAYIVKSIFSESDFRKRRAVTMDIGKVVHKLFEQLNMTDEWDMSEGGMIFIKDPYQSLLDVDWIEDQM